MRFLTTVVAVLIGCGGGQASTTGDSSPRIEPVVEEPELPPRYVLVHRNTPIRLQPSDDAPFLQYRTPERQAELEARWSDAEAKRLEAAQEAEKERLEAEKTRKDRLRKRRRKYSRKKRAELAVRDKERAEANRIKRAERTLRDIERRAAKSRLRGPDKLWIPFRLVRRKGEWLQLSPVRRDADPPHCYARNFGEVDRLDAMFYVRESDLAPVTTKSVTVAPQHGTHVTLRPGVAVRPTAGTEPLTYEVFVDGFVLRLALPADAVAFDYEPQLPFEAPMTDTVFSPIALADGKLDLGPGQPLPFNPYRDLYVTGTLKVGSRFYATTQTPCGEYSVRVRDDMLEPVGKRGVMRLSEEESVKPPFARAGAMAHLPDGAPFAPVRANFPLGDPTRTADNRACFRSAVWGKTDAAVSRSLELCFRTEDVNLETSSKP